KIERNMHCPGYGKRGKDNPKSRDVCAPWRFDTCQHAVYRNNGNGGFVDVTSTSGIRLKSEAPPMVNDDVLGDKSRHPKFYCGAGLAVMAADIDGDGKVDLYVANDETGNFLYLNRCQPGKIKFEEVAEKMGATNGPQGLPNGSMGIDMADIDGNGLP